MGTKLSQILSFPRIKSFCIVDILDISTKRTPLYSSPPPTEENVMSLAPLLAELAHLAMLFILQLTHIAHSVRQLKNK